MPGASSKDSNEIPGKQRPDVRRSGWKISRLTREDKRELGRARFLPPYIFPVIVTLDYAYPLNTIGELPRKFPRASFSGRSCAVPQVHVPRANELHGLRVTTLLPEPLFHRATSRGEETFKSSEQLEKKRKPGEERVED